MKNDVISRFKHIDLRASHVQLEVVQQDRSLVFRIPAKAAKWNTMTCFVLLMGWSILGIGFVVQFLPPPFSWLLGGGLGAMALYSSARFARGVGHNSTQDSFTLDGALQTIRVHKLMQEETIALGDIDYFVFWTRNRLSETERDTRCVTQGGEEIVLHFTQDERLTCMLGYLCEKPAWRREADGTLTQLSLPGSLQSLLRPSGAPNASWSDNRPA